MTPKTQPCPVCGKPVIVRNIHDVRRNIPSYCSRVCASNSRFAGTRYKEAPKWDRLTAKELMERELV